jgi:DNA-binding transcriptional ArsR family regulator
MNKDVFKAIADPTRRQILAVLQTETLPVNALAEQFRMSRPAVSKHLHILAKSGLIQMLPVGRERHCVLVAMPLQQVSEWVAQYEDFWQNHLDRLGTFLDHPNTP